MDSTPDITGHETGRSRFVNPRSSADPDSPFGPLFGSEPAPSGIETVPPSMTPRAAPPPFDTTFGWVAPSWIATRSPAPIPDAVVARGGAETVLSAAWFGEAVEAAEWRAVAAERRAPPVVPAVPARSTFRVWVAAAAVGAGALVTTTATGAVLVAVSALLLLR